MEVPYGAGVAAPHRPRVMHCRRQRWGRSVDRGLRRPAIEPRKYDSTPEGRGRGQRPKAVSGALAWLDAVDLRAVVDPAHARKLLAREPGEPTSGPEGMAPGSAPIWETGGDEREWAVRRVRSTWEVPEQRTRCAASGGEGGGKGSGVLHHRVEMPDFQVISGR